MGAPWTPGPWTVEDRPRDRLPVSIIADGMFIAVSRDVDAARLIASAPDLAEALEKLVAAHVELVNSGDCGFWNPETVPEVIAARAALSKAKGETP